jgi:hypothetical protein
MIGGENALRACDVGADPGILIKAKVNGAVQAVEFEDCTKGVVLLNVNEGDSVEFAAHPVNNNTGAAGYPCATCSSGNGWKCLLRTSGDGGDVRLTTVFGGPTELLSFIANGETGPASPSDAFRFNVTTPPGGLTPTSGGLDNFRDFTDQLFIFSNGSNANLNQDYSITNVGDLTGGIGVAQGEVVIKWLHRATPAGLNALSPPAPEQAAFLTNPSNLPLSDGALFGYNPQVKSGPETLNGVLPFDQMAAQTFDTPSFSNALYPSGTWPPAEVGRYAFYAYPLIPWEFQNVQLQFDWVYSPPDICDTATPPNCVPDPSATSGTSTLTMNGRIYHGGGTNGGGPGGAGGSTGHPALILVAVRDTTPPLAARTEPDGSLGTTLAGQSLAAGGADDEITVYAYDNNPHADVEDFKVEAWYLVERSSWTGGPGSDFAGQYDGLTDGDATHAAEADDSWAASAGHTFVWEYLGVHDAVALTPKAASEGGQPGPFGVEIEFAPFQITEPTGVHYVAPNLGDGSLWQQYEDEGLKFIYRIIDTGLGVSRPAASVLPPNPAPLTAAEKWTEASGTFLKGGAPDVYAGTLDAADAKLLALPEVASCCGGQAKLTGLPTWNVEDKLEPGLVLIAEDLKYERVYYFGELFRAGSTCVIGHPDCESDHINKRYFDAFLAGNATYNPASHDVSSPSIPAEMNMEITPAALCPGQDYTGADDATSGYSDQIGDYLDTFFPTNASRNGCAAANYPGLWIDEDTRVDFKVTAWDNVNGWLAQSPGGGIKTSSGTTVSYKLTDGPTGNAVETTPGIHLFRNPNRDSSGDNGLGDAFVEVEATDPAGNKTSFRVNIYIADNELRIFSLEESRRRLSN